MEWKRACRAVGAGVITTAAVAFASPMGSVTHAATTITLDGHGYGHGIGLSQYGALGYAINFGWNAGQILDHYYGGTVAGVAANSEVTVRLAALDGAQTAVVHDKGALVVDGFGGLWRSLVAREVSDGHFRVYGRTDGNVCPGASLDLGNPANGWTVVVTDQAGPVTFRPQTDTSASADPSDLVGLCEPSSGRVRYYRGAIRALNTSSGANRTVNHVPLEQYLRSVVGGEVSYGWASMGGGQGAQALQAQAVAARSYGLAENRETWAKTCDNVCQTYRGAAYRAGVAGAFVAQEFGPTDAAVAATAGAVRRVGSPSGAIALTMFSSSSGGFTATNTLGFTPVVDEGDAVAGNAGHTWTSTIDTSSIQSAYPSIGSYTAIVVTAREGNGEWGGRVLSMTITGTAGSVTVTGSAFRTKFGLKSNWFQVRDGSNPPSPPAPSPPSPGPSDACNGRTTALVPGTTANTAASRFTPLKPTRLIDTRIGLGTATAPLGVGCTLEIDPDVPADSTAVVVNVTAVEPAMNGHLTAYPCGAEKPWTSIVPVVAGRIVPGTAIVPLNAQGKFCVFASTTTELVVDLSGVYETDAGERFEPIAAQRRYDSRIGAPIPGGVVVRVPITGIYGIPESATAIAVTVHSMNAVAPGYVTIWPCQAERPTTSVLNATTGSLVTNHVQVGLDAEGGVCMYAQTAMHLVLDVSGWFGPAATSDYHAMMPYRALDTREDLGLAGGFAAGQNRAIAVTGAGGVPAAGVSAIAAEVTSVNATKVGFITVHPCITPVPGISMVRNFANSTAATTVTGIVDEAGRWCMQVNVAMDALIDIMGWYG